MVVQSGLCYLASGCGAYGHLGVRSSRLRESGGRGGTLGLFGCREVPYGTLGYLVVSSEEGRGRVALGLVKVAWNTLGWVGVPWRRLGYL